MAHILDMHWTMLENIKNMAAKSFIKSRFDDLKKSEPSLTYRKLAERSNNVSHSQVYEIIKGKAKISTKMALSLAKGLNLNQVIDKLNWASFKYNTDTMTKQTTSLVIGIAGGTGSGKTTIADYILDTVGPEKIATICLARFPIY